MRSQRFVIVAMLGLTLIPSTARSVIAQSENGAAGERDLVGKHSQAPTDNDLNAEPDGTVGADDLLDITVPYCPELTRKFRVTEQGTLALPLLKAALPVAGKRTSEIAKRIADELAAQGYLNNPVVIVTIAEYRSRPITVMGAVNHPITLQVAGQLTLLDALTRAGGISADAGATIEVTRRSGGDRSGTTAARQISVQELLSASNPAANIELQAGDEVRVPEAGKVYVAGNVRHPGAYSLQRDSSITVMKAIALSEGVEAFSSKWAYILRVNAPSADRTEIKVSLSRILARKEPDVQLMAGDIFYIPESGGKKMTSKILSQIAGFGQTAGSGVLIYR